MLRTRWSVVCLDCALAKFSQHRLFVNNMSLRVEEQWNYLVLPPVTTLIPMMHVPHDNNPFNGVTTLSTKGGCYELH